MLKTMKIGHILSLLETEPEFFTHFKETKDDSNDWRHPKDIRIEDLLIRASKEVADRMAETQTDIRKLSYLSFNSDILS